MVGSSKVEGGFFIRKPRLSKAASALHSDADIDQLVRALREMWDRR